MDRPNESARIRYGWQEVRLTVPTGKHTYKWNASVINAGQPGSWLDSLRCKDVPIASNTSGTFKFEEEFVPPEVTGKFVIDNSLAQDGVNGIHPPLLGDGQKASLSFACADAVHSQMSFWYRGGAAAGQVLGFYVDDVLYQTYRTTPNYGWQQILLTVPTGKHKYRFDASVTDAGQPGFWIDSMQCKTVETVANTTGYFKFEEGFVPPEVTGKFVIDNSLAQDGVRGIHPPILGDGQTAAMTFACGGATHTQLSFWYRGAAAAGQALALVVDNAPYQTYGTTPNYGWATNPNHSRLRRPHLPLGRLRNDRRPTRLLDRQHAVPVTRASSGGPHPTL